MPRPPDAPVPHLLADAAFRAGFAELARAFPETAIVLDHVGGPLGIGAYAGKRDAMFTDWAASIRDLATCPNVHVKLGGLGMPLTGLGFHERPEPPSSEELADASGPYFATCIAAFGAERCMFESNFPVDKESFGYAVSGNACKRLTRGAGAAEKAALFGGTAARFYRIAPPGDG